MDSLSRSFDPLLIGKEEMDAISRLEQQPSRRLMRTQTSSTLGESMFDSELLPSSLEEIASILRVANEVEMSNPRVAYLCKYLLPFLVSSSFSSSDRISIFACFGAQSQELFWELMSVTGA